MPNIASRRQKAYSSAITTAIASSFECVKLNESRRIPNPFAISIRPP